MADDNLLARMRATLVAKELQEPVIAGATRHVRTPAGMKHFHQPIGSVIVDKADIPAPRIQKALADLSPAKSRDQKVQAMAASLERRAIEAEPPISKTLKEITEAAGGHMEGFDFRFKKPQRIVEKIKDNTDKARSLGLETTDEDQAAKIGDALRYTSVVGPKQNIAATKRILAALQAQGHTVERIKNSWPLGDDYSGVNVKMRAPNGLAWELQFHTPDSFQTKEYGTHADYAIYRARSQPATERALAYLRMIKMWNQVEQPVGWENFGEIVFNRPDLR